MRRSDVAAILYLQQRLAIGWLRRAARSGLFWVAVGFVVLMIVGQVAAALEGPPPESTPTFLGDDVLHGLASVVVIGGIVVGLWRGTSATPVASLADVVVLMGTPISARMQFALLMVRPIFVNAVVLGFWLVVGSAGATADTGDPWISLRLFTAVGILVLLSELLRFAIWVTTERVIARSGAPGMRARTVIRVLAAGLAGVVGIHLLRPVAAGDAADWRDALDFVIERAEQFAGYPPMSLIAEIVTPGGASVPSAIVMFLLCAAIGAVALVFARDFVEPVSLTAERKTDPRGHMTEAGSDIQWATLSQFGVAPRLSVSLPPFGAGAWALLWAGLVRWLRYQLAAAWITLVALAVFAVIVAGGVRFGLIEPEVAWAAALFMPFFGSINMFVDEMRKPFLFLMPGSTVIRLIAAAIPSVLDGLSATVVVTGLLTILGAIPLSHAAGLVALGAGISLLAQASVALVQLAVPFWVGYRTRVMLTTAVTVLTFIPGLVLLIIGYIAVSPPIGLLVSAAASTMTALVLFAIAAVRFDWVEFSG